MSFLLRPMQAADWPEVSRIYAEGIATGTATFETQAPTWEAWDAAHLPTCRLVVANRTGLEGWAALTPVSGRCVYAGVAEVSVYIAAAARGQGIGTALLEGLVQAAEDAGLWTLQAGIFRQNSASRALHLKCGFREVGYRERIGQLHGVWVDTLLLERRSPRVGV